MDDRAKRFRAWDALEGRQEIVSPETMLPEDDLVFFLLETIPDLDLSAFYEYYSTDGRGQPPFSVPMMVTLLVYAYSVGVPSSRKIAAACERNLAFLAIVGLDRPDFRTISEFRKHHLPTMRALFIEVLQLAGAAGMVKLGNLSTDGTKMEANASRHKAMSYGYMLKELARLEQEVEALLERADQVDAEQDAALGSRRGDELPEELKRREDRVVKIREAKARLEAEARERAAEEQRERDVAEAERQALGKKRRGKAPAPVKTTPADKAQTNFTNPDAKIMKRNNKGFDYCYNAQATVDAEHQIIVAAEITTAANDKQQAVPMAQAAVANLAAAGIERPRDEQGQPLPIPNTADSGYFAPRTCRALRTRDSIRTLPWAGTNTTRRSPLRAATFRVVPLTPPRRRPLAAAPRPRTRKPRWQRKSARRPAARCMRRGNTSWNPCSARSSGFAAFASSCFGGSKTSLRNGS